MIDFTFIQAPNQLLHPVMYPYSLGLLYLAAMLEEKGAKVACVDLRDWSRIDRTAASFIPHARYYGITATTPEMPDARKIAALLRRRLHSQVIIGGVHATLQPEECLEHFDIVARGEWEYAICQLLEKGHPNGIINAATAPDLDTLPFPARRLVGQRAWSYSLMPGEFHGQGEERAAMLISSRGCPYHCAFCSSARTLPVRFRSPENVVEEVVELKERYKVRAFRDESDNLILNRQWLLKLCQLLKPLDVTWKGHGRSAQVTDEVCEALKEAGLVEFGLGIESADPEVLKLARKGETVEEHHRAIALLKKHGVISKIYLMAGLPGESDETVKLNMAFMRQAQPDKWTLSKFTPLPGSEIWQHPERFGARISADNSEGRWFFFGGFSIEYEHSSTRVLEARYKQLLDFLKGDSWRQ